ncbi:hypothetical protein [Sporosarcina cyprini]|uniref:hypothetical protein n=1 Tax=Sporosarcina cyprini TaxID=2910523 RepID=UPI001EDD992D|nr:hypothetical protein [Sporosarcina cyprini]MCG3089901.1 hypothetical protein [Sporosarcina cyprini]
MERIISFCLGGMLLFVAGCQAQNSELTNFNASVEQINHLSDEMIQSVETVKRQIPMTYDAGHQQLQYVVDQLRSQADDLSRGDYIGYMYATDHLYQYLLAIYYENEDILDVQYPYTYSANLFSELTKLYHDYVDFNSIELKEVHHENVHIEITLSYKSKAAGNEEYLHYFISYGEHELKDQSYFFSKKKEGLDN